MITVDHFPNTSNPYLKMLTNALKDRGVRTHTFRGWRHLLLRAMVSRADILHLHWIHPAGRLPFLALSRFMALLISVVIYKLRRKNIVWTVHNLSDHEGKNPFLDKIAANFVALAADRIIVHGDTARPIVADHFNISTDKISIMYHGNYAPVMKSYKSQKEARKILSLPDGQRVALFFGKIRPYKGVPDLLDIFAHVEVPGKLIVAGQANRALKKDIEETARLDPRVEIHLRFIPQDELDCFITACDFVVMPFKDIFTSGSLLFALTFGRPPVIPKAGIITDYIDNSCAYIYDNTSAGLKAALTEAFNDEDLAKKSESSALRASHLRWSDSARTVVSCYQRVLRNSNKIH